MAVQVCDLRIMGVELRNLLVRSFLVGAVIGRAYPNLPGYGELHYEVGGGYQNQGRFGQAIYEDSVDNEEADLTVLVLGANARFPSRFEGHLGCRGRCRTWASSRSLAPWPQSAWSGW